MSSNIQIHTVKPSFGGPNSAFEPVAKKNQAIKIYTLRTIRNERKLAFIEIRRMFHTNKT